MFSLVTIVKRLFGGLKLPNKSKASPTALMLHLSSTYPAVTLRRVKHERCSSLCSPPSRFCGLLQSMKYRSQSDFWETNNVHTHTLL